MRKRSRRYIFGLIVCVVCGLVVACNRGGIKSLESANHVADGKTLGAIELLPLGYANVESVPSGQLINESPSKVTLLHFWGTWCPPCVAEYPELAELVHSFEGPGFRFLSVSCEGEQGQSYESLSKQTNQFLSGLGVMSVVYCDPRGKTRKAFSIAASQADIYYPTSILLDSDRRVIHVWEGFDPSNIAKMRAAINDALHGPKSNDSKTLSFIRPTVHFGPPPFVALQPIAPEILSAIHSRQHD